MQQREVSEDQVLWGLAGRPRTVNLVYEQENFQLQSGGIDWSFVKSIICGGEGEKGVGLWILLWFGVS